MEEVGPNALIVGRGRTAEVYAEMVADDSLCLRRCEGWSGLMSGEGGSGVQVDLGFAAGLRHCSQRGCGEEER